MHRSSVQSPDGGGLWATLRHRDFTKLWIGQIVSSTGDTFYQFALLHVALGASASFLNSFGRDSARVIFCGMILPVLFARWIGQQIDLRDRRKILFWTEFGRGVIALAMLATWPAGARLGYLLALVAVSGLLTGLFIPARQAALPMLVPKELLVKANALMTFAGIVANLLGATAGLAVALVGESFSFLAAAIGFAFSAVMVWRIQRPLPPAPEEEFSPLDRSARAVSHRSPAVRLLVWLTVVFTFVTGLFLPFFVQHVAANIDCSWLKIWIARAPDQAFAGLIGLLGVAGLGLFVGMLTAGQLPRIAHWRLLPIAMLGVWGFALLELGRISAYPAATAFCLLAGWATGLITIPADARLQHEVVGERHGRLFAQRLALSNVGFLLGLAANLDGRLIHFFGAAVLLERLGLLSIFAALVFWILGGKAFRGSWGVGSLSTNEVLASTSS